MLSRGLNYAVTPHSVSTPKVIADVEEALKSSKADSLSVAHARNWIVGILNRPVSPLETRALKELRSNTDIIVLPSDKGRATVIMDRDDYNSKLSEMLSDTTTYKKLNRDPLAALERKMNSTLLGLNRSGQIPDRLYHRLRSSSGLTPRIYGLSKIHKQNVPLRPVVSFYTSPTYQLSKHLSSLLSPFVGKTSLYVRNSREFAQFIINQELEDDEVLISFDVVSLLILL